MSNIDIWEFRSTSGHVAGTDLVGFHVEATDGQIGKVDRHSPEAGSEYLVVDTGPWIFGKHVLLPVGTIVRVDQEDEKIYVDRTKAEIKDGPEFDREKHEDADLGYREAYGSYYGPFYSRPII
ncbi:PRC-barrel domain-containing protein [Streptomyces sp. BE20]|uniref:PRC-barrel domain-containing protein n=1 Tax=Streptomyces sp. BE20 TaxID=3002525 RepID=UPI002E7A151E|nr:PRC-barrel domain-containing protein [Streptomyces sp. BE20]MEE1825567.1 PRC-barrel domain-containing protein [Streptomyces sp. BE20]